MNVDIKQKVYKTCIFTVKVLLCIMLLIIAFVFIFYGLINRGDKIRQDQVHYLREWNTSYDVNGDQTVTFTLPQNIQDNDYLFFTTRNDVSIYINGELRDDFIENRDVNVPGGSFKNFIMSVPLNKVDSGTEVILLRQKPQDIDRDIPEIYISTYYGMLSKLFDEEGTSFVLSFIVLIFSLAAIVVGFVLKLLYKHRINMLYGALGIFVIAAWIITDSYLFPFVLGVYHVNGFLSFMLCFMIPLPLVVFLSSIQKERNKRGMTAVMILSILNVIVLPFVHFTGLIPFQYIRNIANDVLVILSLSGIAILIFDAVKGNVEDYRYTFTGLMGFLIGCLMGLTITLLDIRGIRETIPMVSGLAFFLIFIVIQQVNDLSKINTEKQHAIDISEAKTRFLASMSHEIRTPINAILGMNEMILRENSDKDIEEYSRNIKTSGKMLLMLVNDVLDFTKIESGKLEIRQEDFHMSDMLYDVISLIKERADEKKLELRTEIGEDVPNDMIGDEFRIRQIIINILNNAVKYTEKGFIILQVSGSYVDTGYILSLNVKDSGKGIRREEQEHLFEAFSRADIKSNINIEGTGLGLAIVKSIVDSMKGKLGVNSEYGVGSEFWVKIPIKYKRGQYISKDFMEHGAGHVEVTRGDSFIAPDAKILAVDDNQSNLTIVKLFLKRNQIIPELCSSGEGAVRLCKEKKYDLILLDHMMPEPDGIETLHIIKNDADSLNKDTKVVVLTANAVAGSREMYIKAGFEDYLTKPLDSNLLEDTVKKMLPEGKVKAVSNPEADSNTASEKNSAHVEKSKECNENEDSIESKKIEVLEDIEERDSLKSRLMSIEGLNYNAALTFCGGEEDMLLEILEDIINESQERSERMRKSLEAEDIKSYRIDAHSIKNQMATIGLKEFSERAKKHEFAARDNDTEYIYGDSESFINDYIGICKKISERL